MYGRLCDIIVMRDLNARTGQIQDYYGTNEFLFFEGYDDYAHDFNFSIPQKDVAVIKLLTLLGTN